MLMAVLLFSTATVFSQTYVVSVTWLEDECGCLDLGESYYSVKVNIYDEANDEVVVEGVEVRVDFGTYTIDVPVPKVNSYCADPNHLYTPSFRVIAGAGVYCDNSNPPELCTTGGNTISPYPDCTDFANDDVAIILPQFN